MHYFFITISLFISLAIDPITPATSHANCEGSASPAVFSLYKNLQAIFTSKIDADAMQRYEVEWYIGGKSMGSIIKKGGESFVLKESLNTSQSFSVTGYYLNNNEWIPSRKKIFPNSYGGIQLRFDDGACDNSFVTSPDLAITIKIN
jgi:hypothetical protein